MNPFDSVSLEAVEGLEGLDGLGSKLKKLKTKLKKVVRKVVKVVAPIVVGVVAGPAAGVAVANAVVKHEKEKKAAQKEAKNLGVSWTSYKKGEDAVMMEMAQKQAKELKLTIPAEIKKGEEAMTWLQGQIAAKQTGNPQLAPYVEQAIQSVETVKQNPQTQAIAQQLYQQGYTPQQVDNYFMSSAPVKTAINSAVANGTNDYYQARGVDPATAAATGIAAGEKAEQSAGSDGMKTLLAVGIPLSMLLLG